jgi:hypothetical protein
MTAARSGTRPAGLLGPVALSAGLLLLLMSPLMRGGNRYVALIALEFIGLFVLLALWTRAALRAPRPPTGLARNRVLLAALLSGPILLAAVQLLPLPAELWARLPARAIYTQTLEGAGVAGPGWRAISISPDATMASLLASIPLLAAFLLAYLASLSQLRLAMRVVVGVAFAEVLLGLLQISGGQYSPLFFGVMSYGPPVGTFANRNHYASYIAMALAGYVWLAYQANRDARSSASRRSFGAPQRAGAWVAGGLVLVLGVLMSRSRGAAVFGLPMAMFGLGIVSLRIGGWSRGLRFALPVFAVLVLASAALIGFDQVTARLSGDQLASSAGFRGTLARTSLDGAIAFWPWGSGWGTYDLAYPRFQPAVIAGYANHAHMDYVEMLLEGGIFFVLLAAVFLWLAWARARLLVTHALRHRRLGRDAMAATICGLGLLALLLHSVVEFNLRIPANAILGALLAGAYLRPLDIEARS